MTPDDIHLAQYRRDALRIAGAILCNDEDAEDAAQDACIRALVRLGDVREDAKVESWLHTVAKREALQRRRQRARVQGCCVDVDPDVVATPDEPSVSDPRLAAWVRATLDRLTAHERESLLLVHLEGWTYQELARLRGRSLSAAKMQASRARHHFRELFPIGSPFSGDYHNNRRTDNMNVILNCTPHPLALAVALVGENAVDACHPSAMTAERVTREGVPCLLFRPSGHRFAARAIAEGPAMGSTVFYRPPHDGAWNGELDALRTMAHNFQGGPRPYAVMSMISAQALDAHLAQTEGSAPYQPGAFRCALGDVRIRHPVLAEAALHLPPELRWSDRLAVAR